MATEPTWSEGEPPTEAAHAVRVGRHNLSEEFFDLHGEVLTRTSDEAAPPPKFADGTAPTWIDVWKSAGATVVFTHGEVEWGEVGLAEARGRASRSPEPRPNRSPPSMAFSLSHALPRPWPSENDVDERQAYAAVVAYDEELAHRIREVLSDESGLTERAMFGGLGFMLDGHMAVAAGSRGSLMVRVDPDAAADLVDGESVKYMEMGGRSLHGWLLVDPSSTADDPSLERWVGRGVAFVHALPPRQ